jgi:hypothetical protein
MRAKFENRSDIVRDMNSKAILYVNKEKLQEYKSNKNIVNKYNNLSKEVRSIKNNIDTLKNTLTDFIKCVKENIHNEKGKND